MSPSLRIPVLLLLAGVAFVLGRITAGDTLDSKAMSGDPVEAVRAAIAVPGSLDRAVVLIATLNGLESEDFAAVGELFRHEIANLGELEVALLVDAWTRVDPDAAFEGVTGWDVQSGSKQRDGLRMAMEELAARDPNAAIARFTALSERFMGSTSAQLGAGLVAGMAASDPELLRSYLQELGENPGTALGVALGRVARHQGVETLISWSEGLMNHYDDERLRAKIFRKSVRNAARRDPRRAAEWIAAHEDEKFAADGQVALAEVWIVFESTAALAWLEQAKPEEGRLRAFDAAFRRWTLHDSEAAAKWIEDVERTSDHDLAVLAYARTNLEKNDPERGTEICVEIIDSEMRERCLVSIGRGWIKRDRASALNWIEFTDDIDDDTRDALRQEALTQNVRGKRNTQAKARAGAR